MPEILGLDGDGSFFADPRAVVDDADANSADADAVLPLARWRALAAAGTPPRAVWLGVADDYTALLPFVGTLHLIALAVPKAADGRAYSIATLLRTRHDYRGELRAMGDVAIDQLHALRRVGFDSAQLPPQRTSAATLATVRTVLRSFSDSYQASFDQPQPLFRRRALQGAAR